METAENQSILDIPAEKLTPGMRQYQDAKRANPDCIIMLRMGDFFELFYEDAITAARELEITLTARGKGERKAPLAGVPYHALETYLGRLVKKGYKVALIEQLEDPKKAKGLVKRGLVRIVTPGTVIESSMLEERKNNYIMAVYAVGDAFTIATCDLSTGEFFSKGLAGLPQLFDEIHSLGPTECVVPVSLQVNNQLIAGIRQIGCFVHPLEDYFFQQEKAATILKNHFQLPLESLGLAGENISAAGALLQYLIGTQKNALTHIQKVSLHNNRIHMCLDSATLRNLELLRNIREAAGKRSRQGSLLGVLDKTVTAMGARLLRKWIIKPLLQRKGIEERLSAVGELHKQVILREELMDVLKNIHDIERLTSRINYGNANPKDLISLRKSLENLPMIKQKLSGIQSQLLQSICGLDLLPELVGLLQQAIQDEPPLTVREGGMFRRGFNPELDALHNISANSKQFIKDLEQQEQQETGISSLRIKYNRVFGYYIEITKKNVHLAPSHYVRKQTTANAERYISDELKVQEEKILNAQEQIGTIEYDLFQEILGQVASKTRQLQQVAAKIAELDCLCSLAKVALEGNYVKPRINEQGTLEIINGRHPVVETMVERFIGNDVHIQPGEMMIITGPNMSGKSTIMRQTALMVLLAQIGSFVPANAANISIVDRIFTRVGAHDDLASGQSTFMVEMTETASILHNATQKSLIILDEIGRGTSTFDGVSLAWSVAEHIHNVIKAKSMFATHYHVMNKLGEKFSKIRNYNVAVREVEDEIVLLHKLVEGGTDQSHGIHVAKLAGLPESVVQRAKEIQSILEKDDEMVRKMKVKKLDEQRGLGEF